MTRIRRSFTHRRRTGAPRGVTGPGGAKVRVELGSIKPHDSPALLWNNIAPSRKNVPEQFNTPVCSKDREAKYNGSAWFWFKPRPRCQEFSRGTSSSWAGPNKNTSVAQVCPCHLAVRRSRVPRA